MEIFWWYLYSVLLAAGAKLQESWPAFLQGANQGYAKDFKEHNRGKSMSICIGQRIEKKALNLWILFIVLFAVFMRIWIIIYFVHCIVLATAMSLVAQLTPLGVSDGNVSQCNYQIVLVNKKWLLARLPIVEKLIIGNGWWGPRNLF